MKPSIRAAASLGLWVPLLKCLSGSSGSCVFNALPAFKAVGDSRVGNRKSKSGHDKDNNLESVKQRIIEFNDTQHYEKQ